MEKQLTPEESLQIIQKSISVSRKNIREGSLFYLLWGWSLTLASLTNYFVIQHLIRTEQYEKINWFSLAAWAVFVFGTIIIQQILISRTDRTERVITHLDRYIKILWISAGLLMALMSFLAIKVGSYPTPFILGVTAMATAVSGLITRFRPLLLGGIVFFLAAIVAIYMKGTTQLLVFAAAMLLGYLAPGYTLRMSKNGNDV